MALVLGASVLITTLSVRLSMMQTKREQLTTKPEYTFESEITNSNAEEDMDYIKFPRVGKKVSSQYIYHQNEQISMMHCNFEIENVKKYKKLPDSIEKNEVIVFDGEKIINTNRMFDTNWSFVYITLKISNATAETLDYYVSDGKFIQQNKDERIVDSTGEVRYHAVSGETVKTVGNNKDAYRVTIPAGGCVTTNIGYFVHNSMMVQNEFLYAIDASGWSTSDDDIKAWVIEIEEL